MSKVISIGLPEEIKIMTYFTTRKNINVGDFVNKGLILNNRQIILPFSSNSFARGFISGDNRFNERKPLH